MTHPFSVRAFSAPLLVATLLVGGCKKDEKNDPTPTVMTGLISGRLTPVDAVTAVMISRTSGPGVVATVSPSPSGIFTFRSVSPDTYDVTFSAAAGYDTPPARTVTVTAGDTASVGTVAVQLTPVPPPRATGEYRVDNVPVASDTVRASLVAGLLTISLSVPFQEGISLTLDNVAGLGTYALTGTSSGAYYTGFSGCNWNTNFGGRSGTVVLTQYDAASHTVSGTFTFNAYRDPTRSFCTPTEVNVTHGTFANVRF